jgi:superfamily II DNA or RNA helicase
MPNNMVAIRHSGGKLLLCTPEHPILTQNGWKPAVKISTDDKIGVLNHANSTLVDLHSVFTGISSRERCVLECKENRSSLLQSYLYQGLQGQIESRTAFSEAKEKTEESGATLCRVWKNIPRFVQPVFDVQEDRSRTLFKALQIKAFKSDIDENKRAICFQQNESQQPNEKTGSQGQSKCISKRNWTQAESKRGKWERRDTASENIERGDRSAMPGLPVGIRAYCSYKLSVQIGLSIPLQSRYCLPGVTNSNRGRWEQPRTSFKARTGRKENRVIVWQRVESVEVQESGSNGKSGAVRGDGYVYNLEIEDWHTYLANGVAVHNCHHSTSKTYMDIMAAYADSKILGVTATPCRSDGQGFKYLFDSLVVGVSPSQLIEDGHLSKFKVFRSTSKIDTKGIRKVGGDYNQGQLEDAARKITGDLVTTYQKYAEGKSNLVFAVSIEHSKEIVQAFKAAGISAEHVDGETDDLERDRIFARFRSKETMVLSNVNVATEGTDIPGIESIQVARPTMSLILHLQMLGRGLRPSPGKEHCIIIDHSDNWAKHGLPDEDREWTLEPVSLKPARFTQSCPKCHHIFVPRSHEQKPYRQTVDVLGQIKNILRAICPACLHSFEWEQGEGVEPGEGIAITKERGEIEELDLTLTPKHKDIIDNVAAIAKQKGYKSKWIAMYIIETYGEDAKRFTHGDIRYLARECKMSFDVATNNFKEKLATIAPPPSLGFPTIGFSEEVDKLLAIQAEKGYKTGWTFYRLTETLTFEPSVADWLYVAEKLQYPKEWAYRKKLEFRLSPNITR